MTFIIEVAKTDFNEINSGVSTLIVYKFPRAPKIDDVIIFQEINEEGEHTNQESKCIVHETVTEGLKAGYTAVVFTLLNN